MIKLTQLSGNLIGSQNAVTQLAQKSEARLLVISDCHGLYTVMRSIILQYGRECDAFVYCGDGAQDLSALLSELKENPQLNEAMPPVMAFVQGNCDPENFPVQVKLSSKIFFPLKNYSSLQLPVQQLLTAAGKRIFITHGHMQGVNSGIQRLSYSARENNCSIALFGHTHVPLFLPGTPVTILNPGSCSRPRGSSHASFAILTIQNDNIDAAFLAINKMDDEKLECSLFTPF